jgi:CheY-like chemotaxis protein
MGETDMASATNLKECDSRACELDRIAFERGLIGDDAGAGECPAGNEPNSVEQRPEIQDAAPMDEAHTSILIIDDDDQFRRMLREMLEAAGYQDISEAADGQKGLARYLERPTDLVITDMVMPEKLGIDTIVEIHKNYPNTKIIAISGGSSFGPDIELDMAAKLGVRTFEKPFERQEFLKAIRELLAR